jgi:hypothetical protein
MIFKAILPLAKTVKSFINMALFQNECANFSG